MNTITTGSLIGLYTVVEVLPEGQGGMARVYKARAQTNDNTPYTVALKVMRTDATDRQEEHFFFEALNNEAEILRRLRHPNVIRIYPIPLGSHRATPYIARDKALRGQPWYFVMECLEGGSLRNELKRRKQLPVAEAVDTASRIGTALEYLHSKGIAHRDVKPDNILFRANGRAERRIEPVLVDFGIAAKLKRLGMRAGSIFYMPPERILAVRGEIAPERATDQAAGDVYGLGALLYQMLTGHRPFEGHSRDSITSAILHSTPILPRKYNPGIPPALEHTILKALEKQPYQRPTAEEMVAWIEQAVPPPWDSVPGKRKASAPKSRLPWLVSAVTTACLAGSLALNVRLALREPAATSSATAAGITEPAHTPTGTGDATAAETPIPVVATPTGIPEPATPALPTATAPPSRTPGPATPTQVPTRTPKPTRTPEATQAPEG